jgi:7-cyano-7-deazaguanine synthase
MTKTKVVLILSGGMDSAVLLADLAQQQYDIHTLSLNYGQRHGVKELNAAFRLADLYNTDHHELDVTSLHELLRSSLTHTENVPDGHYAEESMKKTVVPNRNAIMLSIAYGYAVSLGAERVYTAVHAGDHTIYPDCRPDFVAALDCALRKGNEWAVPPVTIYAPFSSMSKADIARLGANLKVPFHMTWSCYKGGQQHCGTCGTCTERREAFELAGVTDFTIYLSLERHF